MRLARYVKFREEKFGGVLFETRGEKVYTLNSTAAAVLREIQSGSTESEIRDRLKDRYAADDSVTIDREVGALLADLRSKGLVED